MVKKSSSLGFWDSIKKNLGWIIVIFLVIVGTTFMLVKLFQVEEKIYSVEEKVGDVKDGLIVLYDDIDSNKILLDSTLKELSAQKKKQSSYYWNLRKKVETDGNITRKKLKEIKEEAKETVKSWMSKNKLSLLKNGTSNETSESTFGELPSSFEKAVQSLKNQPAGQSSSSGESEDDFSSAVQRLKQEQQRTQSTVQSQSGSSESNSFQREAKPSRLPEMSGDVGIGIYNQHGTQPCYYIKKDVIEDLGTKRPKTMPDGQNWQEKGDYYYWIEWGNVISQKEEVAFACFLGKNKKWGYEMWFPHEWLKKSPKAKRLREEGVIAPNGQGGYEYRVTIIP